MFSVNILGSTYINKLLSPLQNLSLPSNMLQLIIEWLFVRYFQFKYRFKWYSEKI